MPNKGLNRSCDWTINNRSDWIMVQSHHTPSQILFCHQNNLLSITFHTQTSGIQMQDNTTAFVITFICMCKELHCLAAAYYWYFTPISQEVEILFSWTHEIETMLYWQDLCNFSHKFTILNGSIAFVNTERCPRSSHLPIVPFSSGWSVVLSWSVIFTRRILKSAWQIQR